ncbi:anthrone oxygenase family protein [Crocosphaera sp. Alani8]|uniref:anthrone oxygenase family protein n=1 Tax=Crocosphaera sp. Alani8 TaxID=3038952 RepID=UPI00313CED31
MSTEIILPISLSIATFLCSLVAGFLFAFVLVVMPGIRRLNDREFIGTFQVIDGIIQNNQPIFVLVWVGSMIFLITSVMLGIGQLNQFLPLLIISGLVYIFGVQLPTFTINVPLNNKLQTWDVMDMNETTLKAARFDFEPRWNRWNAIRTFFACLTSTLLIILLLEM